MADESESQIPDTRVLAVASHVVSGNVGNKIAVFSMQSLGCEVAALNTVQFSNHTGYRQWTGSKVSAEEITDLWQGLKQSYLDHFDMMLSGYIPGAAAVEAVGQIAEELQTRAASRPGSFFWVLDPVMGDNGKLYVAADVVPAYKKILAHADLILPNQFEAEVLSDVKIHDMASLTQAIQALHERYGVPHVVITSVSFTSDPAAAAPRTLSVVGSTMTSGRRARLFQIAFPRINAYFSGTGDMFAALMVVRMREAVWRATAGSRQQPLAEVASWVSGDEVEARGLPLARACEKVLGSMHGVLDETCRAMNRDVARARQGLDAGAGVGTSEEEDRKRLHLLQSQAAELRLVRHLDILRNPKVDYSAQQM